MKNLKLYIALTFGPIWAAGLAFYLTGTNIASFTGITGLWIALCMFIPLVATLICQKSAKERLLRGIGISWKINRWWFIGWLIIPVTALLTILFTYWTKGLNTTHLAVTTPFGTLNSPVAVVAITLLMGMVGGATTNALFAFGEEAGWRGYLLKQFEGKNFLTSAIVIGIIWGLWHAPLILLGYNYPQHPQWGVLFMVLMCTMVSIIIQYFRVKSGSVIVAAIMHGTFNAVEGVVFLFMDINNYNDLIEGCCGLTGICALLVAALGLFLFDRYVTRDRIFTSPLTFDTIKTEQPR